MVRQPGNVDEDWPTACHGLGLRTLPDRTEPAAPIADLRSRLP